MDVSHLLLQTIYTAARTGVDADGKPTFAAAASRAARVEFAQGRERQGADGSEQTTKATIITLAAIGVGDRVWLPGADQTDAAQARLVGPAGVTTATDLGGTVSFYQTEV